MGQCCTTPSVAPHDGGIIPTKTQKDTNKKIDAELAAEQEEEKRVIKCLLLGAGECGKSTLLKQMRILHLNGFSEDEKRSVYRPLILKNTVESMQSLCEACEHLDIGFDSPDNKRRSGIIQKVSPQKVPLDIVEDLDALWKDSGIQRAFSRNNEFHLLDSAPYFLERVRETFTAEYLPSTDHILRSRLATTGIQPIEFLIGRLKFKMFDVGGQRGERKKWIHCFDGVTAIMFIASLSEYDQVLAEDRSRNRLKESLDLFEGIINLPWFKDTPIILFLNKNDLFMKKIATQDIGIYFPAYNGGCDYKEGLKFIQDEYFDRNSNASKTIYCHVTDATNTENIVFVWKATEHIILERNLARSGLLLS